MTQDEHDFLASYDPSAFARPSVSVDLVLMTLVDGALAALLVARDAQPAKGKWALPGGFVGIEEGLDDAARRILAEKARMKGAYVEQLYTFGDPGRDPRLRVISVAYFALLPPASFAAALKGAATPRLARLDVPWAGEVGGPVHALDDEGAKLDLAFDHAAILGTAVLRLRGKLDYSPVGFALLPPRFTLRQLQDVHEAILGTRVNKPAFRRRMRDKGWIAPTGEREAGTSYRPAELYRFDQSMAPETE